MKRWLKQNRTFIIFLLGLGLLRTAVADWNHVPSGSMRPNLLEGDLVFVNRLAYDLKLPLTDRIIASLGDPQRGDIVTFTSPRDGKRLIKRVIGLPGDKVEMRGEQLIINGQTARYDVPEATAHEAAPGGVSVPALRLTESLDGNRRRVQFLNVAEAHDSFGPVTVPPGQYLMLGDNRDNSADSRYFGFVPRRLLIGQATRILVSADVQGNWMPRFDRFGQRLQ